MNITFLTLTRTCERDRLEKYARHSDEDEEEEEEDFMLFGLC